LTKVEALRVAALEGGVPALVEARGVIGASRTMVGTRAPDRLEGWLALAGAGLLASFARGGGQDRVAVPGAITSPWASGRTETQIMTLILVKRQLYERGTIKAPNSLDRPHAGIISDNALKPDLRANPSAA
jgi:transposase